MTKLHETDNEFISSDKKSEDYCRRIVGKPSPYNDDQLSFIGFVDPTIQVTRKDDQNADPV